MTMPGFDRGNHPPIPPTGMPPSSQMAASAPVAYQYTPLPTPAPAPVTAPTPVLMMNAPMAPGNAPTQAPAMNAPMVAMNAPTQGPTMYQYAPVPVPAPAPTQDDYTVHQWKAASAYHEYQAKRFTVEAQQNHANAHRALQAEAELRDANTDLVAKAARCNTVISEKTTLITKLQLQLKMQQDLVTATEISRVELQDKVTAAAEHNTTLQDRLSTTEASCLRLMNEAAEREKILTALTHMEKPPRGSSLRTTTASPKKKLKPKKKKDAATPTASTARSTPTDDEIMMKARIAFNGHMQYGDGPVEHREMEREIEILYKKLIRKRDRDAKKITSDDKAQQSFCQSDTFTGARAGFCFKTGPEGTGYYAEMNTNVDAESAAYPETITETDSENDTNHNPSTPSNSEGHTDEFGEDWEEGPSQETHSQRLLRLDNEHWDKHGRPHPQSSFKVGSAPASRSSSSSSSSSRKLSKKIARARNTRNSRKAASSCSSSSSTMGGKAEATDSGDDDDVVDMSV